MINRQLSDPRSPATDTNKRSIERSDCINHDTDPKKSGIRNFHYHQPEVWLGNQKESDESSRNKVSVGISTEIEDLEEEDEEVIRDSLA